MDHIMGLCPDKKQGLKIPFFPDSLSMFKKNQNASDLFENHFVLNSSTPCATGYTRMHMSNLNSNFQNIISSFQSNTKGIDGTLPNFNRHYYCVGGILGSKSLCRSGNGSLTMFISDFINEILLERDPNCMSSISKEEKRFGPLTTEESKNFSTTVPSPPKKKLAKEDPEVEQSLTTKANTAAPSEQSTSPCDSKSGHKQSYAEVAKASVPSTKHCPTGSKSHMKGTNPRSTLLRESNLGQCNGKSTQQSNKSSTGRRFIHNSQNCATGATVSEYFRPEVKRDRKSRHQTQAAQRDFSRNCHSQRRRKNTERNRNPCGSKTGRVAASQSSSDSYSNSRSVCGGKVSAPLRRNKYCDIEMVNWRTGEPIHKMGVEVEGVSTTCGTKELVKSAGTENRQCEEDLGIEGCDFDRERKSSESCSSTSAGSELQLPVDSARRRSYSSECSVDSEDSFIVFQTGGGTAYPDSLSDLAGDWSDCSSEASYESDSDGRFEFEYCDGSGCPPSSEVLREINSRWHRDCEDVDVLQPVTLTHGNSPTKQKKVHFSPGKPKVLTMVAWDYAYRQARVGPWEQIYRDRSRFQERIKRSENVIAPVLSSQHRAKIWNILHAKPV